VDHPQTPEPAVGAKNFSPSNPCKIRVTTRFIGETSMQPSARFSSDKKTKPSATGGRTISLPKKLLFTVFIMVVAVLLVELAFRLFWERPPKFLGEQLRRTDLFLRDETLGWRLNPGFMVEHRLYGGQCTIIRTNSRGFRDKEHESLPAQGIPRVLVIGDSFAFGYGVNNGEIFTAHLQALLPKTEIINMSVTAYNIWQEHLLLKEEGLALKPDLVLVAFCQNDVMKPGVPVLDFGRSSTDTSPEKTWKNYLAENSYFADFIRNAIAGNKPLTHLLIRLGIKDSLSGFESLDTNLRTALIDYPPALTRYWEESMAELVSIHETCLAASAGLLVAAIPPRQFVDHNAFIETLNYVDYESSDFDLDKPVKALEAFLKQAGIDFVNPCPVFKRSAVPLYVEYDMHFNPEGHKLFAEAIAASVLESLKKRAGK